MRISFLPLLWLAALLATAGCSAAPAGQSGAASHRPTSTVPVSNSAPTTARCPQLPAAQPGQPPAAPPSLYVSRFSNADNSVSLAALNASDGATRWQATINQDGYALTSVAAANNVVYVITAAGAISALNASDGRLRWCVLASEQVISAPNNATGGQPQLVVDQGLVYAAGGCRGTLLALDADGTQRWQAKTDDCVTLLTAANGQVYATTEAAGGVVCALAAFKASDGQKAWCFQPGNNLSSPPVLADGVAYASEAGPKDGAGFLDTLNLTDGSVRSRVQLSQSA
ncbi:MAG TPA: PQQ-binding-like beta-propeller repeat protein, partial [Ktedonobacterales bacterium]